jgi:hypothetical protein
MLALLAALIAVSPLLIDLLIRNASCFGSDSACSDMAKMFERYGRSWIMIVALIPLTVMIANRTLTAGVFAWAFPFALLMLAGSLPLFYAIGTPEISGWGDLLSYPSLVPLLFLLVLLVALGVEDEAGGGMLWHVAMGLVAVVTLFITSAAWLPGIALMPFVGQAAQPAAFYFGAAHHALGLGHQIAALANTCLIAFVLAAAGMMVSARARNAY